MDLGIASKSEALKEGIAWFRLTQYFLMLLFRRPQILGEFGVSLHSRSDLIEQGYCSGINQVVPRIVHCGMFGCLTARLLLEFLGAVLAWDLVTAIRQRHLKDHKPGVVLAIGKGNLLERNSGKRNGKQREEGSPKTVKRGPVALDPDSNSPLRVALIA